MNVQTLADKLARSMERRTRNDGHEFYCLKDSAPQWMTDVIQTVHRDTLPDDTIYDFIYRAANALAETDLDVYDDTDLQVVIDDIQPDIYTSDLTAWLHANLDHLIFADEALRELFAYRDTPTLFEVLQTAQQSHIQDVGATLLDTLRQLVEQGFDPDVLPANENDYWWEYDTNTY